MVQLEERIAAPPRVAPASTPPAIAIHWYPLAFVALVAIGFLLRIHRLGERAIHHDESLHALYSWYLYVGRGYVHDPMMHGPWQFHFPALIYFLFGDSDFTARLGNVLFGTWLIAAPYFLRHELGRTGALVASFLLAISPAFLYFSRFAREDIYFAGWNALIVVGLFGMLRTHRERYLYIAALGLAGAFATKEAVYISGFIFVTFFATVLLTRYWRAALRLAGLTGPRRPGAPFVGGKASGPGTGGAAAHPEGAVSAESRRSRGGNGRAGRDDADEDRSLGGLVWSTLRAYPLKSYAKAVALVVAFDAILFTTFFTNMGDPWNCLMGKSCTRGGLWTGTVYALQYWFEQHDVQRGGQPWFYYGILLPLYEFVPLLLAGFALVWRAAQRNLFYWFCLWWAALAIIIYSYAGEKMPWIVPHMALPIILLGSQAFGTWLDRLDLARLRSRPSLWVAGLGLLALAVTVAALGLNTVRTLTPLERQTFALEKLSFVLVLAACVAAVVWISRRFREALIGPALVCSALVALLCFYVHTSWQLSYAHGDIPVEMLVYVQSSPDVPQVVEEIERISFQTGQGKDMQIIMDNGYSERVGGQNVVHEAVSWPFEWYLRHYKNRRYYSRTFPADWRLNEYPVALIMGPNVEPVRDKLGDYNGQKYKLNWWYPEDYKGLKRDDGNGVKWDVIWAALNDPQQRARLLQYVLYREVLQPLGAREFYFFARKEIPPLGPAAGSLVPPKPAAPPPVAAPVIPAENRVGVSAPRPGGGLILARSPQGSALLSQPKDLAVGPDGRIYAVEAGAHRVTVFQPDGSIAATWGREGTGDGEFKEPWGIAVAPGGEVYVADTWNHRIQKFDAGGRLLKQWGGLADVKGQVTQQHGQFYGPRDIAIGPDELLYVTDTGNKRIQVFDPEGRPVRAFGGEGAEPGKFREPVGLAFSGNNLLVADTWNRRVQTLDPNGRPLGQVPVTTWEGTAVTNKPYLAVDQSGRTIISAPDSGTLLVLGPDGQVAATLQPAGDGGLARGLPTGVAPAGNGEVYVADSRSGFVYRVPVPR